MQERRGFSCWEVDDELSSEQVESSRCHRHGDNPDRDPLKSGAQESNVLLALEQPGPSQGPTNPMGGVWGKVSLSVLDAHSCLPPLPPSPSPDF